MELQTISQVSKAYGISTRMMRYYEQAGLIQSLKKEDYSYRVYDEDALKRLQQIILLRKLQIPVKKICIILDNPEAATVIDIFKENISELEKEISALSTIKSILESFVLELKKITDVHLNLDLLNEDSVQKLAESLFLVQKNVKERFNMNELTKAADFLNKLKDVRVVYLPPMTVASAYFMGEKPEEQAWQAITDFVNKCNLLEIKPDLRLFKIDHHNATGQNFGYEMWVSVPDDFIVPAPLVKKKFLGGQYASYILGDKGFENTLGLQDWINESDKYQFDYEGYLLRCDPPIKEINSFGGMGYNLDEVLNFINFQDPSFENQIDLLIPIKSYKISEETPVEIPKSKEKCGFKASIVTKNKFKIMGFTNIMTQGSSAAKFINEVKTDGRLDILNKYRKPGASILGFESIDMDSQIRGGWRVTFCLAESDITDVQAFMAHNPFIWHIDASKWLIFERTKGDAFDDHDTCMKLGYTWNGIISGSFSAMPDGKIGQPDSNDEADMNSVVYCWYPVK